MTRGDLVTVALPGAFGKPRPALVAQADLFRGAASVTVLPLTSAQVAALFRVPVEPSPDNGLHRQSWVMVDKAMTVRVEKVSPPFGRLDDVTMQAVNRALALFLGVVP